MVKEFLTIFLIPPSPLEIWYFWLMNLPSLGPTGINGSILMIQLAFEAQITRYAHWPISREAIRQARTAEELYDVMDWKHPASFWWLNAAATLIIAREMIPSFLLELSFFFAGAFLEGVHAAAGESVMKSYSFRQYT